MGKKVLIVDDTKTVRMFLELMLRNEPLELAVAIDGVRALDAIANDRPDLVLLDVMMPLMNGIEVCRRLKTDPATRDIAVIIVTTLGDQASINAAFEAGCDDFLTKPVDKHLLIEKVRKQLAKNDEINLTPVPVDSPASLRIGPE